MKMPAFFTLSPRDGTVVTASCGTRNRSIAVTRMLGAIALLLIGGIHYQQYHYAFYSAIPTIGAAVPRELRRRDDPGAAPPRAWQIPARAPGNVARAVGGARGIGLAASGLAALLISEHMPLFGFIEHGYRFVIVLTITSEAVAIDC